MPKPCPREFRDGAVALARDRGPGVSVKQIVKDLGIRESCLGHWLRQAGVEEGPRRPCRARRVRREPRAAAAREAAGAGERGAAPGGGVLVAGQPGGRAEPKMMYPLVRGLAVDGVPVAVACRVLKIARQPYCRWLAEPVTSADRRRAELSAAIREAHLDDPEFGCRLVADEARARGLAVCDRTGGRIRSRNRWWSAFGKKKGRGRKRPGPPVREDLVHRGFTAKRPNQLRLTGITEHPTSKGKLYLCAVKDVFSNRIVGYPIGSRMESRLAVDALDNAVARRGDVSGCLAHSDRGSLFRSRKFARALNRHGLLGPMGRVGSAGDNAAMESFFSLLQKNVLNRRSWTTRHELRLAVVSWIERTYHRRRRQAALGKLTPVEYEAIMNPTQALAA